MAEIMKVTAKWSGNPGGAGYSNFYFRTGTDGLGNAGNAQAAANAVRTFFNSAGMFIPNNTSIQVQAQVEGLLEDTGQLTNVYDVTAPAVVNGSVGGTVTYAAATGAVVSWYTSGIRRRRRVRGRTFLVPIGSSAFENNGTLSATFLANMNPAASTLMQSFSGASLVIWGRPSTKGATDGVAFPVSSFRIPDMSAVLRSRRD